MADDNETLERIRKRAYELWEADGKPDGQETAHWVQATTEILGEDNQKTGVVAPPENLLNHGTADPLFTPPNDKSE